MVTGRDVGPVITRQAKERIERAIGEAEQAGAKVLVDGRGTPSCPGARAASGSDRRSSTAFVRRCGSRRRKCSDRCSPSCGRATSTGRSAVENASPYGNAASIFTESGGLARR